MLRPSLPGYRCTMLSALSQLTGITSCWPGLNLVGIAELVAVGLEDLHVLIGIAVELLR